MKKWKRFLALVLSVLTLVFSGCALDDLDEDGDATYAALDGTKVLSKPASYDLSSAMCGYSTNFFNLFSKNVLELLYEVYENPASLSTAEQDLLFNSTYELLDGTTNTLTTTDIYTYDDFLSDTTSTEIYYLLDSIRYTITSIYIDENGDTTLVFDTSSAWDLAPSYDATDYETIFDDYITSTAGSKVTVTLSGSTFESFVTRNLSDLSNFAETFYSDESTEISSGIVDYYSSPTYTETGKNFLQDMLEYVSYLTVLGYNPTDNSEYFDFTITKTNGAISNVTVGGWGTSKINLSGTNGALSQLKDAFESLGKYVGLTDSDREQIVSVILDIFIGSSATKNDTFTVTTSTYVDESTTTVETASYSRNYQAMVERIVDYACLLVPIGSGSTLEDTFLIAEIIDYDGDYFFMAEDYDTGGAAFDYIEEQEFQSVVIFPSEDDVKSELTFSGIGVMFEYGAGDADNYADSIVINVGVRYFNHKTGLVTDYGTAPIEISKGSYDGGDDMSLEDLGALLQLISSDDPEEWDTLLYMDDIVFNSDELSDGRIEGCFNNSIGSNAINAREYGTERAESSKIKSITITSASSAKNYYKTNTSSGYGTYATLNEQAFSGDDGCDFFELYFDVEKSGNSLAEIASINYNFKVAFWMLYYY